MWSHYAENHRGICLEFNVFNAVFMTAVEVTYRSQYPIWTPYNTTEENAVEMVLTKAADWCYEKEFRIIARSEVDNGHPLRLHGQRIRLPENALVSVVVGCESDHQAINRIVDQHVPGLPVRRIKRVPNHYKLTIEDPANSASTL